MESEATESDSGNQIVVEARTPAKLDALIGALQSRISNAAEQLARTERAQIRRGQPCMTVAPGYVVYSAVVTRDRPLRPLRTWLVSLDPAQNVITTKQAARPTAPQSEPLPRPRLSSALGPQQRASLNAKHQEHRPRKPLAVRIHRRGRHRPRPRSPGEPSRWACGDSKTGNASPALSALVLEAARPKSSSGLFCRGPSSKGRTWAVSGSSPARGSQRVNHHCVDSVRGVVTTRRLLSTACCWFWHPQRGTRRPGRPHSDPSAHQSPLFRRRIRDRRSRVRDISHAAATTSHSHSDKHRRWSCYRRAWWAREAPPDTG